MTKISFPGRGFFQKEHEAEECPVRVALLIFGAAAVGLLLVLLAICCSPGDAGQAGGADAETSISDALAEFAKVVLDEDREKHENIAVSRLAENRDQIKESISTIKTIGEAVEQYVLKYNKIPQAESIEKLIHLLAPTGYVRGSVPTTDGWGNQLYYECGPETSHMSYSIISFGVDNKRDPQTGRPALTYDPNRDIVWSNGAFVQAPGDTRQYTKAPRGAEIEVAKAELEGENAVAVVNYRHKGEIVKREKTALEFEDGKWKVTSVYELPTEAESGYDFETQVPVQKIAGKTGDAEVKTGDQGAFEIESPDVEIPDLGFEETPADTESFLEVGRAMEPPVFIGGSARTYPQRARMLKKSGYVDLEVRISSTGEMVGINVLEEYPQGYGFADAAVRYFQRGRWRPAKQNGRPVNSVYKFKFEYKVESR